MALHIGPAVDERIHPFERCSMCEKSNAVCCSNLLCAGSGARLTPVISTFRQFLYLLRRVRRNRRRQ